MTVPPIIAWFSPLDYVAFAFALLGALWIGWRGFAATGCPRWCAAIRVFSTAS